MDLQNSHLAAALMSGTTYNTPNLEPSVPSANDDNKMKPPEPQKEADEDKEEIASGEEFSDEEAEAQAGSKSMPGRGVTLQMLLEEKMLEPGNAAMTIEYLGQKFVGDLQADGKIKSHETETIFCSPSAWAIHCKRIINPDKRSGCGWASVKYRGKKLDTIKATYLRKKQIQRENMHTDEETEMEVESPPEPPPQRIVMKHNTVPNRMMQHDSNMLIEAVSFSSAGKVQPFTVSVSSNASLVLDIHCHLKKEEVYGYFAGTWDMNTHNLLITHTFPCLVSKNDTRPRVMVELEIQMEIEKLGLTLLGWYHSHPTNPAMPSLRDCDNQLEYQIKMRGPSEVSYVPCIGVICSPYNPESPVLESSLTFFWVMPPPEQRPTEYPRPLLLQYNLSHDTHLSQHAMEQIRNSIKYYTTFADETFIDFKENFKPDITYLDKLKCTLSAKFPREQSDGLLWHFIKEELGCSSGQDDKMDLDALLAVPQPIPVSKPTPPTSVPNFPSVSTLQQMVSRPAGVPPINVSSGIGSGSPHKFETPQLNIPVLPTSKPSSSKAATPTLPPSYPTGLDMLTSMALGLGTGNMSMPLGASGLESLAAANSMLSSLTPGLPSSLTASLAAGKLPDPPSYAASLQNLTNSLGSSFDKTPSSTTTSASSTPIPASIASNLMMSSADIANALFSATKYSNAGILGIPDPMSKSTLAANNMFLSPSLMKMQESLMKPLSSSSPISSKVGLDQSPLMKSPHDLLKGSKDYGKDYSKEYGKDYSKEYGKEYSKDYSKDYAKDYGKDYGKEYAKDYNKDYSNKDYSKEQSYSKDYSKEQSYSKDYSKEQGYSKDYSKEQGYSKDYSKEQSYSKDYSKEYGKDYAKDYGKEYVKDYGKDYAKDYAKEYGKDYAKDYGKDYAKEYGKDYSKDYGKDYSKDYSKEYSKDYSKEYLPPDFGSIGKGKPDTSVKPMELSDPVTSSKVETSKSEPMDTQATDFSMPPRVGGESFLNQMMELTKKTTMPDYMPDYSRPELQPIKLSKTEELASSKPGSSHSYLNSGSIVDTIAQVAMGNFSKQDQPLDYGKEQDYSKHKPSENDK